MNSDGPQGGLGLLDEVRHIPTDILAADAAQQIEAENAGIASTTLEMPQNDDALLAPAAEDTDRFAPPAVDCNRG